MNENGGLTVEQRMPFDPVKLAEICRRCIGRESIKHYSERCSVSLSALSKILNMRSGRPSKRTLLKIASAAENSEETGRELFIAAGYEKESKLQNKKSFSTALSSYYSTLSPILAAGIFADSLVRDGGEDVTIKLKDTYCVVSDQTQAYVIISAFFTDDIDTNLMYLSTLGMLTEAWYSDENAADENIVYCIITNRIELFQMCVENTPKLSIRRLKVLYTEDNRTIKTQCAVI